MSVSEVGDRSPESTDKLTLSPLSTSGGELEPSPVPFSLVNASKPETVIDEELHDASHGCAHLLNSEVLFNLMSQLSDLTMEQKSDTERFTRSYRVLFGDVHCCTTELAHDIIVGNVSPVEKNAYCTNLAKWEIMKKELRYP